MRKKINYPEECAIEKKQRDKGDDDTGSRSNPSDQNRNEIKEVEKLTNKESWRVFVLHRTVTLMLLVTAVTVISATFILLRNENKQDYSDAVSYVSH